MYGFFDFQCFKTSISMHAQRILKGAVFLKGSFFWLSLVVKACAIVLLFYKV